MPLFRPTLQPTLTCCDEKQQWCNLFFFFFLINIPLDGTRQKWSQWEENRAGDDFLVCMSSKKKPQTRYFMHGKSRRVQELPLMQCHFHLKKKKKTICNLLWEKGKCLLVPRPALLIHLPLHAPCDFCCIFVSSEGKCAESTIWFKSKSKASDEARPPFFNCHLTSALNHTGANPQSKQQSCQSPLLDAALINWNVVKPQKWEFENVSSRRGT